MKLAYLADIRFPMERANGIQTVETAHALARHGIDVELVVRRTDDRSDEDCLAFFGLTRHPRLHLNRVATPLGRFSFLLAALGQMRGRADVLFTRDLVLAEAAIRFGRAPVVYEAHTVASVFAEESARMYATTAPPSAAKLARLDARERRVCRKARGLVSITHALAAALEKRHGALAPTKVIPDGSRVGPEPPERRERSGPPRVYYIGQLYPWKGVDVLVEAMTHVEKVELVVVGGLPPEPDLDRVQKLANARGLADRVTFRGFVRPPELAAEREAADVFVIPLLDSTTARLFTSPLKLFEAMASGRPIVASDLPSIREVLTHEDNALLVPPDDAPELASAIRRVVSEPELARRIAAKALADVKAYTWDRRAATLASFLERL